jgi:hypothetical protein
MYTALYGSITSYGEVAVDLIQQGEPHTPPFQAFALGSNQRTLLKIENQYSQDGIAAKLL